METLSVCMIVKNEARFLDNCLKNIKNIADEIIIVDTGSIDKTIKIAKKYTPNVFNYKWNNDFSEARNFALAKATKTWILSFDADELVSKNDQKKIKELIKEKDVDAYLSIWRDYSNKTTGSKSVSTINDEYEEGKLAKSYIPSLVLRLFRNKDYKFEGIIHETVHNSILKSKGIIKNSDIVIHHIGTLSRDSKDLDKKRDLYITLLEKRLKERKFEEKPEWEILYELATEYLINKQNQKAQIVLEKAIDIKPNFYEAIKKLGEVFLAKGELDKGEELLKKAININSNDFATRRDLGTLYAIKKDYPPAITHLSRAIELNKENAISYLNLGSVYLSLNEREKAQLLFQKAIEIDPTLKRKFIKTK